MQQLWLSDDYLYQHTYFFAHFVIVDYAVSL